MSDDTVVIEVEQALGDAENAMRRAGQLFAECDDSTLLHIHLEVGPVLAAVAKAVTETAGNVLGSRHDESKFTVRGIEYAKTRAAGSYSGWQVEDYTDLDGDSHIGLLNFILDCVWADENGESLPPLERVRRMWNLGQPRLTVLDELGIKRTQFATYTPSEKKPWKVTPVSKMKGRKK